MKRSQERLLKSAGARVGSAGVSQGKSNATVARRVAFDALNRVYTDQAYATFILAAIPESKLSPEDRKLAYQITLGVLRRQLTLDYFIRRYSERSAERLDLPVLIALRIGLYQLRYLDRIPHSAAVNESVNLVKQSRSKSAAGFVNAVLRKAAANLDDSVGSDLDDELERASVELSHPRWILDCWTEQFGEKRARSIAAANNGPGPLAFRVNTLRGLEGPTIALLESEGARVRKSRIAPGGFVLIDGASGAVIRAAREGLVYVQDEGSQLVALMLDPRPGDRILDVCAAPGSKSSYVAALSRNEAQIVACDLYAHRLSALQKNCRLLGVTSVDAVACDATRELPLDESVRFDRVLLDAPCSGTGTLRQNPEIKWRLQLGDISRLAAVQLALLTRGAAALKPGGVLVYSTCSLEREENEDVVAQFLENHAKFEKTMPAASSELITDEGFVRTFPDTHGADGFFVAVLKKRA